MPDGYTEFTSETLLTPSGINQLNGILRTIYENFGGDLNNIRIFYGYGSPESVITSGIGSIYLRADGGTGTSVYFKESGTGNTGWVDNTGAGGGGGGAITYPLSISNGGTAAITANSALNNLLPDQTGNSGKVLSTDGVSSLWSSISALSNYLFQYEGCVDLQGTSGGELANATSLTPAFQTAGGYRFLTSSSRNGSYNTVWTSQFIKISGISTVTVFVRIWGSATSGGSQVVQFNLNIGGQTGNVSGTADNTTPEWKSFTIDVSSLINGTTYDVTATMGQLNDVSQNSNCSNIIGFGS